jgi:hypothetical protein
VRKRSCIFALDNSSAVVSLGFTKTGKRRGEPESVVVDVNMRDLAFDDDGPEQELTPRTPVKGPGPRKRATKGTCASAVAEKAGPDIARLVEMPRQPGVPQPSAQVRAAYGDKKLHITLESLP